MVDDLNERATVWGLQQRYVRDLLVYGYRSGNVVSDARNFYESREFREVVEILGRLGKPPNEGHRVIDVGCGNGVACYAFSRMGYRATGVDVSEGELAGLRGARSIIGLDGADFCVYNSDMHNFASSDGQYDIVYLRQSLHHSSDPKSTVSRLSRLLVGGGLFCAIREHVVLNRWQLDSFLANHPFHPITQDECAYTLKTYRSAFREAGLRKRRELFPFDSDVNYWGDWNLLVRDLSNAIHVDLSKHPLIRHAVLRLLAYRHQRRRAQFYSFFYQKGG